MRMRSFVGAVCGALALSAFAAPAAQAEENPITFSSIAINSGRPLVVGTGTPRAFRVHYSVHHGHELYFTQATLYAGGFDSWSASTSPVAQPSCRDLSATVARCEQTLAIDPKTLTDNGVAGTWHVYLQAVDSEHNVVGKGGLYPTAVKRASTLAHTAAGPEPVVKGETLTVTGKLAHADWHTHTYVGRSGRTVELQFRPVGGSYRTVKTVQTGSGGALRTTVTASADGSWRWLHKGDSTVNGAVAVGDAVDVK
ncbi:calcium-binding protein [Streptomyces cinereospinus]|uniref:Calcium-binding protein n=1 Tax=Streptomyces cinereospinus TaxID=285561 RepID=A0ABV5N3I3_9ACTN